MQEYILIFDDNSEVIGFNTKGEAEAYAIQLIEKNKQSFQEEYDLEAGNSFSDMEGVKAAGIENGTVHAYIVEELINAIDKSDALEKEALKNLLEEDQIHFDREVYSEIMKVLDYQEEVQLFSDFNGRENFPGE